MARYLYGAAVQGIQSFIFQTNKLQEIVGASELVEKICTDFFKVNVKNFKEDNLILSAAGNIKYIFEDKSDCQDLVMKFPKAVMELAPGITISQAVVKMDIENPIDELEKRLRIQRNKSISITQGIGLMVTETARKTGGVGVKYGKDGVIDLAQKLKQEEVNYANKKLVRKVLGSSEKFQESFPFDIEEMVKRESLKSWIAVVHADGNNLGNKIMKLGEQLKGEQGMKAFKAFSNLLDKSTTEAAKEAFNQTIKNVVENDDLKTIPFRPVILGGDDFTGIIRGDLALNFTESFLENFERFSKENFKDYANEFKLNENPFENGLTACAGIAYIKASYPFHYGVSLAESLCQEAKKHSKGINKEHSPSSLMFHKVQSSFVEEYDDIIENELKAKGNVYFNYGPYFISNQDHYGTIQELKNRVKIISRKDAPKSGLRNWLNELKNNPEVANQSLMRIADLNKNYRETLHLNNPFPRTNEDKRYTPIYDAISLSNLITQ
jgi:hypothetical protein